MPLCGIRYDPNSRVVPGVTSATQMSGRPGAIHNADSQNGNSQFRILEDRPVGESLFVNTGRSARKNQSLRIQFANTLDWQVMSNQLAEHTLIANPARDQLCGLATEIENKNQFFMNGFEFLGISRNCHLTKTVGRDCDPGAVQWGKGPIIS